MLADEFVYIRKFILYLCFCPGEVTLQHAGILVCVNCWGG